MQELARVAVAFAGLESQCQDNCANAHGLLGAMEGLRHVAKFFLGVEAAAELRPTPAMPADAEPLSTQEAKATFLWDLAKEFAALVTDIKWRYAARAVPAVNESGVDKRRYVSVDADEDLVSHLTGTCADALALLGQMVHKVAGGGFPFTDVAFQVYTSIQRLLLFFDDMKENPKLHQILVLLSSDVLVCSSNFFHSMYATQEVVSIGKSFVKLQVECAHGSVTSDAVIDAMQALKKMAVVFAGTGVASALRPDSPWSSQGLNDGQNKVAYMWDLSAAFSVLFYDVKFRCVDPKSLK
jgi:hypothetical protein